MPRFAGRAARLAIGAGGLALAMVGAFGAAACGPHQRDGGAVDAAPFDAAVCAAGETRCDSVCVDRDWDPQHCGTCDTACTGAAGSCGAGRCVAPGSTVWERHYPAGNVATVAVDRAGNVYVAGTFHGTIDLGGGPLISAGAADIIVASFSPRGEHRWSKRIGGPGGESVGDITVVDTDGDGEIALGELVHVVGGFSQTADLAGAARTSAGLTDAFRLVLSAGDASLRAAFTYGTAGDDYATAVVGAADGTVTIGGVFATGTLALPDGHAVSGSAGGNAFLASFTSDGSHRWSRAIAAGGGTGVANQVHSLAIDGEGNVTAAGEFWGVTEFGGVAVPNPNLVTGDAFVASYRSTGQLRWARTFGSPGSERAYGVAADPAGNIVAGGSFDGTVDFGGGEFTSTGSGLGDGWLTILDAATGETELARPVDGELTTAVRDVAIAPSGAATVVAEVQGALDLGAGPLPPRGRIVVASLARTTGAPRFAARYGAGAVDGPSSVAVSRHGALAVAGIASRNTDLGLGPIVGAAAQYGFVMVLAPPTE